MRYTDTPASKKEIFDILGVKAAVWNRIGLQ
jgi:hypothetical protein